MTMVARTKTYLDLAARLAMLAEGRVEPNPLVGCVIVSPDARIIGVGHHRRYGGLHAEREALEDCRRRGLDPRGATMYVTLEPCNGHGKQPPCTEAVLASRVARVVCAGRDPSPTKGGGAERLQAAGIEVEFTDASPLASGLARPWLKRLATGLPWVIAKWAQTIDGRIATRTGASKWISGETSRRRVHSLRGRVDAILTGIGTVLADDPLLTVRGVKARRVPRRVIIDADLRTPPTSQLARTAREVATTIYTIDPSGPKVEALRAVGIEVAPAPITAPGRLDLRTVLADLLARHGVSTVLVEAGPGVLGALLAADLVDEARVYIAPIVLGDEAAPGPSRGVVAPSLADARRFRLVRARRSGDDLELFYRR